LVSLSKVCQLPQGNTGGRINDPPFLFPGRNTASPWWRCYNHAMSRRDRGSTAVLERLLDPVSRSLNIEAARKLVQLKADAQTQARVDELARKCNEGELTSAERSEYEAFVTAGNLIAILQAKARLILAKKT
jgi:hypothetical protein